MFVSIPFFNVSADIDLKMKLKGTVLEDAFYQESSRLYNTLAFQAAEVIFNPRFRRTRRRQLFLKIKLHFLKRNVRFSLLFITK